MDRDIASAPSLTEGHVELLATKWWTVNEFRQCGKSTSSLHSSQRPHRYTTGVPCRDGPLTPMEANRVRDAIRDYREVRPLTLLLYVPTSHHRPKR